MKNLETPEKNEPELIEKLGTLFRKNMLREFDPPRRGAHPVHMGGLLKASFTIEPNLPESLKIGLFREPRTYRALVRISNSRKEGASNKVKDGRGLSIKLLDVPGQKFSGDSLYASTQDFVLMNTPVMPLGTIAQTYQAFQPYFLFGKKVKSPPAIFLLKLLDGSLLRLLRAARLASFDTSPLDIRYWSLTPYFFGDTAAKFAVFPTSSYRSSLPDPLTDTYLTDNMARHLAEQEASFDFMVQLFKDQQKTPVETIGREWKESDSPFFKVATLRIPPQDFLTPEREALAEDLWFYPGHCLIEHKPLGGVNRARLVIYKDLFHLRRESRGKEVYEPTPEDFDRLI